MIHSSSITYDFEDPLFFGLASISKVPVLVFVTSDNPLVSSRVFVPTIVFGLEPIVPELGLL